MKAICVGCERAPIFANGLCKSYVNEEQHAHRQEIGNMRRTFHSDVHGYGLHQFLEEEFEAPERFRAARLSARRFP